MTRHGRGRVRPRWDFQFPILRYRGAEYCCICGATFPSDDGLKRHLAIHRCGRPDRRRKPMSEKPYMTSDIRHLLDPDAEDDVVAAADSLVKAYSQHLHPDEQVPTPQPLTRQEALMASLIAQLANIHEQLFEIRESLETRR